MVIKNPCEYNIPEDSIGLEKLKLEYEFELATLKLKEQGTGGNHDTNRYL
ncbi:MAG: hypothetical protein OIN89_07880 [Candidatus Methanoperedens sp.]|jgi:hypothetical protein|nr:hypothetical protein [Candidatus Methanoperedens sp.]